MIGFGLGWQELMIVLVIVLLLFGSTKLPALMKGLAQGFKEFKQGMNDPGDEFSQDDPAEPSEAVTSR